MNACFDEIIKRLRGGVRVAVVCPDDDHTKTTMKRFSEGGEATFCPVGGSPAEAAARAVAMVRGGEADVLMKGLVSTDILLRAVLDKEHGLLPAGEVMSHVAAAQVPSYHKMILFSDAAVIPRPDMRCFDAMLRHDLRVFRALNDTAPRVALIHCNEKTSDKFPVTLCYEELTARAVRGVYGDIRIGGPMDIRTAFDAYSAEVKGIHGSVAGDADILLFPEIEAANVFYKTLATLAGARTAGVLTGTTAPVVVPSRADSIDAKCLSLAVACVMAQAQQQIR